MKKGPHSAGPCIDYVSVTMYQFQSRGSAHIHAAVYIDTLTGDEGCFQDKAYRPGDILGLTGVAEGRGIHKLLQLLL